MASFFPAPVVGTGISPVLKVYLMYGGTVLVPIILVGLFVFFALRRPLLRQEQARILMDIMESAFALGRPVEQVIVSLSHSGEKSMGYSFHILASHLEKGMKLGDALEQVPRLLPAQVVAMLRVGESLGDIPRVLPACRLVLNDGASKSRASMNYQIVFALVLNPLFLAIQPVITTKILPIFHDIYAGYGAKIPFFTQWMAHWMPVLVGIQLLVSLCVYSFGIMFIGGPRGSGWLGNRLPRTVDLIQGRFPWRRLRCQRDFATLLALLLDSGVPEDQALALAGAGTGSPEFQGRAEQAAAKVRQGVKLTEAVQTLDSNGEFRWRLENAVHGGGRCGFTAALTGWRESLDARAYQQEQAGAQCISTVLLFLNAAAIALVALAVYSAVFSLSSVTY